MEDRKGPEYLGRFLGAIVALLIYLMVINTKLLIRFKNYDY